MIEPSLCFRSKIYVLLISMLTFAFKFIGPIIFSVVKKVTFPKSRNFSTIKEIFHNQGNFPQSKKFLTIKEIFCKQRSEAKSLDPFNTKSYAKRILSL